MENSISLPRWQQMLKQAISWVRIVERKDGQRFIDRYKLAQLILLGIFTLSCIFNYLSDIRYSLAITLSGAVYSIFLLVLHNKGYNKITIILLPLFLNVTAFLLCFVEGVGSGAYFFYFLIVVIANFISEKENYAEIRTIYAFTFIMLIITFIACPKGSTLQNIDQENEQINLLINAVVSFVIGGVLSYHMMKDNFIKEKSLVSKQRYLDSVYNTSLDAVFIMDLKSGFITDCNNQSVKLFQAGRKEEIVGTTISNLFIGLSPEQSASFNAALHDDTDEPWQGELNCVTKEGKSFAGYVSIVPITIEGKDFKKINVLDFSDIKEARAALETAKEKAEQAVFARTRFVSNMSHELRTPLNGIIGTANLLRQEKYLPEQKQYFEVLKYSSEHMLNLINEILDFSKIEAGKMDLERTPFDLWKNITTIQQLFEKQFEEKNIELKINIDPRLQNKNFIGDPTRLNQVLNNLVSNSLKFTEQGSVEMKVSQITQNSHACTIRFEVRDTGIGIPPEKQQTIFDSFTQVESATTRKFGGTGLGLTISSKIVELYGGKLQVDSVANHGSCFYFTIQLDLDHKPASYVNEEVVRELKPLKGLRILIAEDNPINMLIAKAVLDKWDVVLTETVNGKEAWEMFQNNTYDALLVDLEMPEMDGHELLAHIRNVDTKIPVIAFTAALYENMQAHLINSGFNDYVQKPFRPEDLHAKLALYTGRA